MLPVTIGILSPLLEGSYFGALLKGMQEVAQLHDVRLIAIQVPSDDYKAPQPTSTLPPAFGHIAGWIGILDAVRGSYLQAIKGSGKPIVAISTTIPEIPCPIVVADNYGGMAAAVRHLLDHGHRRIAFVGSLEQYDLQQRYAGYQAALQERGVAVDPSLWFAAEDNLEFGGRNAAQRMLSAGVDCTAVVTATDLNALGFMEAMQTAGYRIPEDIAIVGFDDMPIAQSASPSLSSVRQRFEELGNAAAELLLRQLSGEAVPADIVHIETTLVQRHSCGCNRMNATLQNVNAYDIGDAEWDERVARTLVSIALYPRNVPREVAPASLWPGVSTVVRALSASIRSGTPPRPSQLIEAWQEVLALTTDNESLQALISYIEQTAHEQLSIIDTEPEASTRCRDFIQQARYDLAQAAQRAEVVRRTHIEAVIQANYEINLTLLGARPSVAKDLGWLGHTAIIRACVGLWTAADTGTPGI